MRTLLTCLVLALGLALAPAAHADESDPFEQPVRASSHALPDGVETHGPDAQTAEAGDPDGSLAESGDPDDITEGASPQVVVGSQDPDDLTTTSTDLSDLPSAEQVDDAQRYALPPPPPLPVACSQPAGDAGWSQCLGTVQQSIEDTKGRLAAANAAYSRSITHHVPTGAKRLAIIQEREAARRDLAVRSKQIGLMLDQAQQAGVSNSVISRYQTPAQAAEGW